MNILILGNGFDLAHHLPTSYKDFLEFENFVYMIYQITWTREKDDSRISDLIEQSTFHSSIKNKLLSANRQIANINSDLKENKPIISQDAALNEFFERTQNNIWIDYFKHIKFDKGWIDFENEINNALKELSDVFSGKLPSFKNYIYSHVKADNKTPALIIEKLETDLKNLIRALEIYFDEFVNHIEVSKQIKEICNFNPDYILSFNYTNTYKRLYGQDCCQIHGIAKYKQNHPEKTTLVLGIPTINIKLDETSITYFYKQFQRRYNETETGYSKWIQMINRRNNEYLNTYKIYQSQLKNFENEYPERYHPMNVMALKPEKPQKPFNRIMIFGHSLMGDADILKPFFMLENTNIIIYCNGETDYKNKWEKIYGPNAMIEEKYQSSVELIKIS